MATQGKTAGKIKTQITRFSNRLSSGLNKPKRRFLHQMIYGIQASKDIKLSNIGRSLGEEIPLKKIETRLSRQINDGDLTEFIGKKLTGEAKCWIKDGTVLALDLSDISKEYSKKVGIPGSGKERKPRRKDKKRILDIRKPLLYPSELQAHCRCINNLTKN